MSRTYRAERRVTERHAGKAIAGKLSKCEVCDAQYPRDEMYPICDEHGVQIGLVCEVCSADMDLIEEIE
jgi:hypothetical protein